MFWELFRKKKKVMPETERSKQRKLRKALRQGIKDCSTCSFDRILFEGPGCYRCEYWGNRSLNEVPEKEKQRCHTYRENPDCTQCSLYEEHWVSRWCDYFDVSCAETAVLTHPAATGSWGCTHWKPKRESEKVLLTEKQKKVNRDAAYERVESVIGKKND